MKLKLVSLILTHIGPVPSKDMQTSLSFAPIFMKDAPSAESIEKSISRFLFFELWLIVFTIYQKFTDKKKGVQKCSNLQERCGLL